MHTIYLFFIPSQSNRGKLSLITLEMSRPALNTDLLALIKRTYSTTAAVTRVESRGKIAEPKSSASSDSNASSMSSSSWVPDPVTGYYRPGNRRVEIDAAKMRETLLSHKTQD